MAGVNAFAVPPPLVAARKKRRVESAAEVDADGVDGYHTFFSAREYEQFSQFGGEAETQRFQHEQQQRQTLMSGSETAAQDDGQKAKVKDTDERKRMRILVLLENLIASRFPDTNDLASLAENGRRRLSALTIDQHEAYLGLIRKRNEAQSRGLPAILALSSEEATQLRSIEDHVNDEQIEFFRIFKRAMAPVQAQHEANTPSFAHQWFEETKLRDCNNARRLYAPFFRTVISMPIETSNALQDVQAGGDKPVLTHVKEVFRIGTAALIDPNQLVAGLKITGTSEESARTHGSSSWTRNEVISADPHAEGLMLKYNCDVALSSSTMLALFDVATSSNVSETAHRWVIPVKNRVVVGSDGKSRKLVCLDRALCGPDVRARDKIALSARALALDQLKSRAPAPQTSDQTIYHVWQIGEKRVLIRTAIHGYLVEDESDDTAAAQSAVSDPSTDSTSTRKMQRSIALSMFVKPDYRDLGLREQLTVSERSKFWLHSWIRGNSRVVIARLNPATSAIAEWEIHSLQTLIYGRDGEGEAQHADHFDPTTKFDAFSRLITCLCDLPSGNHLVRPSLRDKRNPRVDILSSTTQKTADSSDENENVFDLVQYLEHGNGDSGEVVSAAMNVLPEWYRCDRIPYTFRTSTYCQEFLQDGACSLLGTGQYCEGRHIRLDPKQSAASQWRFQDFTTILRRAKHADNRKRSSGRPVMLQPSFSFCAGEKTAPAATIANLYAPVKCRKNDCQLRHLSGHEIAERVAEAADRSERGKRRAWRKYYEERGRHG